MSKDDNSLGRDTPAHDRGIETGAGNGGHQDQGGSADTPAAGSSDAETAARGSDHSAGPAFPNDRDPSQPIQDILKAAPTSGGVVAAPERGTVAAVSPVPPVVAGEPAAQPPGGAAKPGKQKNGRFAKGHCPTSWRPW
jgi:hypothetical protein